jgi:large subunit ribosomal protein L25
MASMLIGAATRRVAARRFSSMAPFSSVAASAATGAAAEPHEAASFSAAAASTVERRSFVAVPREVDGTRASRKLRGSGWIPSVMYGGADFGDPQLLQVETKALNKELRELKGSFNNTLYDLHVGDKTYAVLPRQLQIHPASDRIQNLTFLAYEPGTHAVDIPLRVANEDQCVPIRRGAFFLQVSDKIKCTVDPGCEIPPFLEVDLAGCANKEVLRISKVRKPEGVNFLVTDTNWCAGTVVGKRVKD